MSHRYFCHRITGEFWTALGGVIESGWVVIGPRPFQGFREDVRDPFRFADVWNWPKALIELESVNLKTQEPPQCQ